MNSLSILVLVLSITCSFSLPQTNIDSLWNPMEKYTNRTKFDFLECTPDSLVIVDVVDFKYPVECRLRTLPSGPVTVMFEAYGVMLTLCSLQFTTSNWNVFQTLNIMPVPDLFAIEASTNISIVALAHAPFDTYDNAIVVFSLTRTTHSAGTCRISGDPVHFLS